MKKRSDKMRKIVALAETDERHQGVATGQSRRRLEEQVSRLGELNAYRHSYAQLAESFQRVDATRWKDYQTFMARLDEAIRSQQQIVRDSERNLERHRHNWQQKRQRLESLQRVLDSYCSDELRQSERREQKALDDLPRTRQGFRNRD